MTETLEALVSYLAVTRPSEGHAWQGWCITPITGGANNLLYRVRNGNSDQVVKFTVRDTRSKALREYWALAALWRAGLRLAPEAVWVDPDRYAQPVVVQTWLEGAVLTAPPATKDDRSALLDHYCRIHSFTPDQTEIELAGAVINASSMTLLSPYPPNRGRV